MDVFGILAIIFYILLFVLYIMFFVKVWKACTAMIIVKDQVIDMSYRDIARYVGQCNRGEITDSDQAEAKKILNSTNS